MKPQIQNKNNILILIHILGWAIFVSAPIILFYINKPEDFRKFNLFVYAVNTFIQISFFYFNYRILIPYFLLRKKFFVYTILALLSILVVVGIAYFTKWVIKIETPPKYVHRGGFLVMMFFSTFTIGLISLGIRVINEWYKNEKLSDILEKEKLANELAYLKSQMNPHFFFNVLNNICSLARKKSDDTETAIIKLSQLMRYNLYTSEEDKVELEKEIQYLNDYIDIQKMRLTSKVQIDFKVTGNIYSIKIEPLLFISFVENAFKHGVLSDNDSKIDISIVIIDKKIIFKIINFVENNKPVQESGGIGLKNIKRRLNLLYPGKHILTIKNENNLFTVDLTIETHD